MPRTRQQTQEAQHRAAMKAARADLRAAQDQGWAWDALYGMLRRVLDDIADGKQV